MNRVAITGAGGYVGGHVAASLARQGHDVLALVRRPAPWLPPGVEQRVIDLDGGAVPVDGAEVVVHLAGANESAPAERADDAMLETLRATMSVAASASDVSRIVFVSTVHVYGAAMAPGAIVDEQTVPAPRHWYGAARLTSEHLLAAAAERAGIDLVVLRLSNAVGPPPDPRVDRSTLLVNDLARQAACGDVIELRTHGLQWRDFVPIDDAVDAVVRAAAGEVPAGTFNLASGHARTVRSVAERVAEIASRVTGRTLVLRAPAPPDQPPAMVSVSNRALAEIGITTSADLDAAIEATVRLCAEQAR